MSAPARMANSGDLSVVGGEFAATDGGGPNVAAVLRFAYMTLGAFALIFGIWAYSAPLNSAAIAQGVLEANGGGRRVVQHLEGGIIKKFLVVEGQFVRAGQPLVELDRTQSAARGAALQTQYDTLLAQDARLTAERLGRTSVAYPEELTARAADPDVKAIIAASDSVFATRRSSMGDQMSILHQRIGQTSAEINGVSSQMAANNEQFALLAEEEKNVSALVDEGLERRSRLLALQRQKSATAGQRGQFTSMIARLNDAAGETRSQMAFLRGQQATEAASQQRDVQMSLAETREKLKISRDISKRQQIVAPVAGTVVNLRLITLGAVVSAGQPILDIVPAHEQIVIKARLHPNDIDMVHQNLPAEVRLTPYKARSLPMLHGVVKSVSPDSTFDEATRTSFYEVQVVLNGSELKGLTNIHLVSGMPAEVFIDLGSRSMLQYLVQPFIDSFHRAFREA